jgi:DNA repair exonuclease SbcCD ATPase subunit
MNSCKHSGQTPDVLVSYSNSVTLSVDDMGKRELINGDADSLRLELVKNKPLTLTNLSGKEAKDAFSYHSGVITTSMKSHAKKSVLVMRSLCQQEIGNFLPKFSNPKGRYFQRAKEENKRLLDTVVRTLNQKAPAFGFNTFVKSLLPGQKIATLNVMKRYIDDHAKSLNFETILKDSKINLYIPEPELSTKKSKKSDDVMVGVTNAALTAICLNDGLSDSEEYNESRENFFSSKNRDLTDGIEDLEKIYKDEISGMNYSSFTFKNECEALKDKLSDAKEELSELESSVSSVEENKQRIEYLKEFIGESDNKIYDLEEKISDSMFLVNFDTSKQEACLEFIENTTGNKEKLLNKVKSSEDDDFDNLKRNFEYCGGLLEHELGFISVKSDFIENKIKNLLSIDFEESTFDDVNSLFRVVYKGIEELSSYSENVLDQIRLAEGGDKNKIDAALITLAALTSSLEEMIYGLSSFSKNISASFQGKEIEESDPYYNFISTVDNSTRSLSDLNDNVMDCKKYFDSDSAKMFVFKEVNSKAVNSRYLNDSISALEKEIDEIQSNLDNLSEKRRLKTSSIENLQCLRMEVSNFDGENFDNIKKVINQSSKGFFDEYLSEGFLEDESLRGDIDLREYINVSSLDRDIELGLENVSEINAEIDILKSEIDVNKSQFSDFSEQREEIERLDFVVENDGQNGINGFLCPAFKNEKAQSIIEEIDGMKSVGFDLSKLQKEYEELESYVQEGWKKLEETCEKIDSLDKNKATRAQYEYLLKQLESSESYESLFSNISDNPSEYLGSSIQENSEDRVSSREEEIAYLEKEVNELLLEKGNYTSNLNKEKIDLKKLNEEKDKLMESSTEEGDTALKYLEDSIDAKNREIFSCVEICKKFDADISKNDASLTALRAYTSDVSDFCLESKRLMDLLESNLCENTEKLCKANNALKERIFQTPRLKVVVKKSSSEAKKDMTLKAIGSADLAYLSPLTTRPKGKRIDTPSGRVEFLKTTKELPLRMLNSRVKSKLKSVDSWSFHGIPGYDEISKKAKNYCEENSGESEISLNKIMKSFQDISVEHNTSTVLSKESPAKIFSCVTRLVADAVVSGISGAPPKLASNSEERTQLVTVLSDVLQKNIKIDDFVFDSNLDVFEQISQNIQDSFRDIVSQPGGWYAVCCREGAFSSNFYEVMGVFSGEPIDNVVQPCNKYKSQFYASMMDGFNEDTITSLCDHRRLLCDNNDLIKRVNVLNLQVKDLEYFAEKSQILVKALEKSDEDADGNSLDNLKKSGEDKTIAALKIKISGCKEEISFINANIDKLKSDKKELAKKIEATKEVKSLRSVAKRYVAALRGSLARDKSILSLNDKVVVKLESCVRKESNQESSFDIVFDFSSTDALFSTPFSTPFSDDDIASNHPDGLERFSSEGIPESEETIVLRPQPAPRTSRATTTQPMPRVTTPSPPKPSRAQTPPPAEELTALSGFRDFIDKQETFLSMEEESGVARELYENFARELCMGLKDEGVIFTPEDNYFIRKALISLDGIRQMLDNEKLRLIENNEGNEGEIAGQIESLENGVTYLNKKYEEEASRLEEMEKFDDLIDIRRESCAYFNDLLNDTDKMEDFKRIPSEERESMLNKAISILDSQIKSKMKELDYIQRDRESLHSIAQSANAKKTCVEFVEKHKAISNECKNERGIKRRLELLLFSEKETLSEGDSTA